jgi:glycerol-3-phosphate dehydrogenase
MAINLEDILARRTRCLFLNAFETEKIAPKVASIMAKKLGHNKTWIKNELTQFNSIIKKYQL